MHIKNNKWLHSVVGILFLSLVVLMMPFPSIVQTDSVQAASVSEAYDYPIKPGTDAWKAFTTHDEMLKACQIPDDILENMSTKALVESVLDYPLYGDMMVYDSIQQGFEAVASRFNGLSELLNRKEAGTELLAIYSKMNPQDIEEAWGDIEKGAYARSIANVEILLAQNKILDNLTATQLGDLLLEARSKYTAKLRSAIYGLSSLNKTVLLIEQVSQRHYTSRQYYSYVYTPHMTSVGVIVDRPELTAQQIADYSSWVQACYPFATKLRNASAKYNCHSYAWYSQSSSNNKWMNNPSAYWTDGSYTWWWLLMYDGTPPPSGAKMRWLNGSHSAIFDCWFGPPPFALYKAFCTSKWGEGPLMYHCVTYCPYAGDVSFYV